jgi:hypothetical protein
MSPSLVIKLPAVVRGCLISIAIVFAVVTVPGWLRNPGGVGGVVFTAVFGSVFLAFLWRAYRMSVVGDSSRVDVRDVFRTRHIPSRDVQAISIGRNSSRIELPSRVVELCLASGEVVPLRVTSCLWLFPWTRSNFQRKLDNVRKWHSSLH